MDCRLPAPSRGLLPVGCVPDPVPVPTTAPGPVSASDLITDRSCLEQLMWPSSTRIFAVSGAVSTTGKSCSARQMSSSVPAGCSTSLGMRRCWPACWVHRLPGYLCTAWQSLVAFRQLRSHLICRRKLPSMAVDNPVVYASLPDRYNACRAMAMDMAVLRACHETRCTEVELRLELALAVATAVMMEAPTLMCHCRDNPPARILIGLINPSPADPRTGRISRELRYQPRVSLNCCCICLAPRDCQTSTGTRLISIHPRPDWDAVHG